MAIIYYNIWPCLFCIRIRNYREAETTERFLLYGYVGGSAPHPPKVGCYRSLRKSAGNVHKIPRRTLQKTGIAVFAENKRKSLQDTYLIYST